MIFINFRIKSLFFRSKTFIRYMLDLLFIVFISFSLFAACYVIYSDFSVSPIPYLAMSNLLFNLSIKVFFMSVTISFLEFLLCSNLSGFFFFLSNWISFCVFNSSFICLSFKVCFYSLYHIVLILEVLRGNNLAVS